MNRQASTIRESLVPSLITDDGRADSIILSVHRPVPNVGLHARRILRKNVAGAALEILIPLIMHADHSRHPKCAHRNRRRLTFGSRLEFGGYDI
jgi:hypothetical protein